MAAGVIPVPKIVKTADPLLPQFLFEYHEHTGKVYCLEFPGRFEDGTFVPPTADKVRAVCVAEHCDTHGRFLGFVQTFLRGYKKALIDYPNLEGSEVRSRAVTERLRSNLLRGETNG